MIKKDNTRTTNGYDDSLFLCWMCKNNFPLDSLSEITGMGTGNPIPLFCHPCAQIKIQHLKNHPDEVIWPKDYPVDKYYS